MIHSLIFDNPGTSFLLLFLLAFAAVRASGAGLSRMHVVAAITSAVAVLSLVVVDGMNVFRGGILWHDGANILSIAAAFLRGQAMYTAPGAADFYSLFYGPFVYLIYSPFLTLRHDPFLWMRVAISVANVVSLCLLYRALRSFVSRVEAASLLTFALAVLLARPNELLGFRGDCWLLLCMSVVVYLLSRGRGGAVSAALAGLACGVAADIKVTALPIVLLALYAIFRRRGARGCAVAVVGFALSAGGVFLLPRISFQNYVSQLLLSEHQRFLRSTLFGNLVIVAMLLAPALVLLRDKRTASAAFGRDRVMWLLAALSVAASALAGSKESAGFWHLWPVMPFVLVGTAYQIAWLRDSDNEKRNAETRDARASSSRWIAATVLAASLGGAATSAYFAWKDVRVLRPIATHVWKTREAAALAELQQIANAPRGKNLSMGYGGDVTDFRSNLRYILPLSGQAYFFDENEVIEATKERLPVPASVLARVMGCEDDWLVPHGEVPFSSLRARVLPLGDSPYIFPDTLRLGFPQTHRLLAQGSFYDRWGCDAAEEKSASLY